MTGSLEVQSDAIDTRELETRLGLPGVLWHRSVGSTMGIAHDIAASGASAGTLIVADEQTAGRGRDGRQWRSEAGAGVWLTLLERRVDADALGVLSLRVGINAARALDPFATALVGLKWPNDLLVGRAKLAGILVEARWRAARLDWVAIGVGVNLRPPAHVPDAASLRAGVRRSDVLTALVPAIRAAAAAQGALSVSELSEYASRDAMQGRRCTSPVVGDVLGIDASGALLVRSGDATVSCRSGSLVLEAP